MEGRNALLRLAHEIDREEPLFERQVRVVKHRFGCDRELVSTCATIELVSSRGIADVERTATDASNAVRPPQLSEHLATLFLTVKLVHELYQIHSL